MKAKFCREEGIRTLDTLLVYTHFPGVRLRPLGHLSSLTFLRVGQITKKILVEEINSVNFMEPDRAKPYRLSFRKVFQRPILLKCNECDLPA